MKLRRMWLSLAVLMAACGGPVQEEDTALGQNSAALVQSGASEESIGGGTCGKNTCGKGTFCCNASCGTCAPVGGGCPQVVCDTGN